MERVEHRIKLNLMKTGLQGQVNVKKADTDSRKVCIYLSYAAKPFDLNDVVSAVLRAEKPDGKVMFNSCTVCEDRLEYIITTQTIAATGTVTCEITLTSNSGQILVTPRFEIIVADVIYSDSEIESTNEYTALEKAIKKASALKDGTTFTPSVSDEGVLSWSNSDGKDNPAAVNIKGPKGDPGAKGDKGKPGKDGASELFIVNVQAQSGADGYTITSHNKTYEQIDAAYKAGKQVLIAFTVTNENNTFLIPLGIATETDYEFLVFANAVFYVYVDNTDTWDCYVEPLEADSIKAKISADSSAQSLSLQTILNSLVYPAVEKAHEHSNKSVLDGLSDSNGVLYYNNKPIIAQKISEGPYITLADNTEYRLTDVTTLKLSYPVGDFESWMRLTFAASGDITVTLPAGTGYIGTAPDFQNGETWELSFKDKILAAQKVGDGT
nr:MAG TPA: Baseplate component [Caudoviricetes sp.]